MLWENEKKLEIKTKGEKMYFTDAELKIIKILLDKKPKCKSLKEILEICNGTLAQYSFLKRLCSLGILEWMGERDGTRNKKVSLYSLNEDKLIKVFKATNFYKIACYIIEKEKIVIE